MRGFAEFMNGTPKYVASRTLTAADITWSNAELISGDLLDFVRELKSNPGGDIAVQGSMSIVRQCVEAGLMDALTLIIHPALAGSGGRLFDDIAPTRLSLLDVQRTQKGNILATYGPFVG